MNKRTKELNRENNRLDARIFPENEEIYTDMICYLRSANLSDYEIEVVRQDIIDMILSAQSRGESLDTLFGGDYQQFCDEILANLPPKTKKQKAIGTADLICWLLSILFSINILVSADTIGIVVALWEGNPVNWRISVNIGMALTMGLTMLLAYVIVDQVTKHAFRKDTPHAKWLVFGGGAALMLVFIGIAWLGRATLFTVHIAVACAVTAALFVAHKILGSLSD